MKEYKKYLAELVGTFALTLVVYLSLASNPAMTPFFAAITLGLFVYTIGGISGSHINPAITIAAWSIKKISRKDAIIYIIAQFIGTGIAFILGKLIWEAMEPNIWSKISGIQTNLSMSLSVGFGELLGAAFFAFGIASVIYGKTQKDASGVVIGGSLLIGITIAGTLSNGILNPAVALGIGSFNLMYLFGPIVGAILGMWSYKVIAE